MFSVIYDSPLNAITSYVFVIEVVKVPGMDSSVVHMHEEYTGNDA